MKIYVFLHFYIISCYIFHLIPGMLGIISYHFRISHFTDRPSYRFLQVMVLIFCGFTREYHIVSYWVVDRDCWRNWTNNKVLYQYKHKMGSRQYFSGKFCRLHYPKLILIDVVQSALILCERMETIVDRIFKTFLP